MRGGHRRNDEGTASTIGVTIGIVLFTLTFAYVMQVAVDKPGGNEQTDVTNYQGRAAGLADALFVTGNGWYGADPCITQSGKIVVNTAAFDPDAFSDLSVSAPAQRFGLGDEACGASRTDPGTKNNLSFAKVSNLYNAEYAADPTNDYVDYEEARHSLGLTDTQLEFHLRSAPVMNTVRDILKNGVQDPYLRPLYIGDYADGTSPITRPNIGHSSAITQDANYVYLSVTIDQILPTVSSNFQVSFSVPLEDGTIVLTKNTLTYSVGQSVTVTAALSKTKDWDWADDNNKVASYVINDPLGSLASGTINFGAIDPKSPANNQNNLIVTLSLDRLLYQAPFGGNAKWPEADYVAYRGDGSIQNSFDGDDIDLRVVGTGIIPYTRIFSDPNKNGQSLQDPLLIDGTYRVEAWVSNVLLGSKVAEDHFQVVTPVSGDACNVAVGNYAPQAPVGPEASYLDALFTEFTNGVGLANYHTVATPYNALGDVFPDVKCALNQNLAGLLTDASGAPTTAKYTTIFVGSNVDHNAMTSGAAKNTIRDWVLAGGTLVVFGSDDQSVQWLQPLFHAALDSANTGIYTPDESHPVLVTPNDLDHAAFDYDTEWEYGAGTEELFTHVITTGGESDVLGLSNAGAFGEGKALLSSWRPYALTTDQSATCSLPLDEDDNCQALFLMHNLATQSYREMFLDYGPELPIGAPVGVATRIVSTWHPELEQLIALEMQVFVFGGS